MFRHNKSDATMSFQISRKPITMCIHLHYRKQIIVQTTDQMNHIMYIKECHVCVADFEFLPTHGYGPP